MQITPSVMFERHSRGVRLTPAGQALQRHAKRILADVDHLAAPDSVPG